MVNNGFSSYPTSPFIIDKIYPNRVAMEAATANDNIALSRYVAIRYCDEVFDQATRKALHGSVLYDEGNKVWVRDESQLTNIQTPAQEAYITNYLIDLNANYSLTPNIEFYSYDQTVWKKDLTTISLTSIDPNSQATIISTQTQIKYVAIGNLSVSYTPNIYTTPEGAPADLIGKRVGEGTSEIFNDLVDTSWEAGIAYAHAEGENVRIGGRAAHAEGHKTQAAGDYSHSENFSTVAGGVASHAEGESTDAAGTASHAEGSNTVANNNYTHAEGNGSYAGGLGSHAEGENTQTYGEYSHAEGKSTIAGSSEDSTLGSGAHAEGIETQAQANGSHSEGENTIASGRASHAEGGGVDEQGNPVVTEASGEYSHAEGHGTKAEGKASHAGGTGTVADQENQTAIGQYNESKENLLFVVGNGDSNARSNAFEVFLNGTATIQKVDKDKAFSVINRGYLDDALSTYATQQYVEDYIKKNVKVDFYYSLSDLNINVIPSGSTWGKWNIINSFYNNSEDTPTFYPTVFLSPVQIYKSLPTKTTLIFVPATVIVTNELKIDYLCTWLNSLGGSAMTFIFYNKDKTQSTSLDGNTWKNKNYPLSIVGTDNTSWGLGNVTATIPTTGDWSNHKAKGKTVTINATEYAYLFEHGGNYYPTFPRKVGLYGVTVQVTKPMGYRTIFDYYRATNAGQIEQHEAMISGFGSGETYQEVWSGWTQVYNKTHKQISAEDNTTGNGYFVLPK